jgi:hypothetical protein
MKFSKRFIIKLYILFAIFTIIIPIGLLSVLLQEAILELLTVFLLCLVFLLVPTFIIYGVFSDLYDYIKEINNKDSAFKHSAIMMHLAKFLGVIPIYEQLEGLAHEYKMLYQEKLRDDGKIKLFGGKQEFIRIGAFDDIDMGMMVHSHAGVGERKAFISGGSTGFIGKTVRYIGKEAHSGAAPHEGINALNAAMLGLIAIHVQRETFRDEDQVKVHPIITKGGELVNIVPADVRVETYVRGKTIDAVVNANKKVNRALKAGAYAVGAKIEINEIPGYLPLNQSLDMNYLFAKNIQKFIGKENVIEGVDLTGSTDAGDISLIMPMLHPTVGGFLGNAHSKDFKISDPEMVYIIPAKAMALTVVDLLFDDGRLAKEIKSKFKPSFSKDSYLKFWDELIK